MDFLLTLYDGRVGSAFPPSSDQMYLKIYIQVWRLFCDVFWDFISLFYCFHLQSNRQRANQDVCCINTETSSFWSLWDWKSKADINKTTWLKWLKAFHFSSFFPFKIREFCFAAKLTCRLISLPSQWKVIRVFVSLAHEKWHQGH